MTKERQRKLKRYVIYLESASLALEICNELDIMPSILEELSIEKLNLETLEKYGDELANEIGKELAGSHAKPLHRLH